MSLLCWYCKQTLINAPNNSLQNTINEYLKYQAWSKYLFVKTFEHL